MRKLLTVFWGALLLFIFSCGGDGVAVTQTGNPSQVSLYTQVGSKKATTVTATRDGQGSDDVSSITITSAKIVVEEVELSGDHGELAFDKEEPYVIDIALDSSRKIIDSINGTSGKVYTTARLTLVPLDEKYKGKDSLLAGMSIFITGFVNGDSSRTFNFESDMETELIIPLDKPFTINNKGTSVLFLTLDVGSWFQDDEGELYDPFDDDFQDEIEESILEGIYGSEEDEDDWEDDEDEEDKEDEEEEDEDEEEHP